MNVTQTDLAKAAGTSRSYLAQIEAGRIAMPNAGLRRDLARELGVRHVDLLVAAGELTEEEIATVAPRWPDNDERRVQLWERIEALPDGWLDSVAVVLGAMALAATAGQTHESPPSPLP